MRLPDGDGVTVCRELRSRMPELACLILTSLDDEDALLDSIMAGAAGYVLKQISGTDLVSFFAHPGNTPRGETVSAGVPEKWGPCRRG